MRCKLVLTAALVSLTVSSGGIRLLAQASAAGHAPETPPPAPYPGVWRSQGSVAPCVLPWGGVIPCPPPPGTVAIRAGRLFDSLNGKMLTRQVILIHGQRIVDVGAEGAIAIPPGTPVIDLSSATVLPGFIDTHDHIMTSRGKMTADQSLLAASQRARIALHHGFTAMKEMTSHGNGYQDVTLRDAINSGMIVGPRLQVSGRGIVWGGSTPKPNEKPDPELLNAIAIHNVDEARAAVRVEVEHGVDHIKLYPAGNYRFTPTGEAVYEVTYPLDVLKALVDEAHKLGVYTGSHAYGGEGLQNAITAAMAGDTIEHGFGLTQDMCTTMAKKGLFYSPTIERYSMPSIDETDDKNTGGRYRMVPIFQKNLKMCIATPGVITVFGTGSEGATIAEGTNAIEFSALVRIGGMTPAQALQAATINAAKLMRWGGDIGSISKGTFADIIAVSGDPLADIRETERVAFVMKGGEVFRNDLTPGTRGSQFLTR
jgi:imidazolonepropionase-like amidohydrolase